MGSSVPEIFVLMNEYGFRVEPGFVVAHPGDRLEFRNVTEFSVTLEFKPEFYDKSVSLERAATGGFQIRTDVRPGFYPYRAIVDLGRDQRLNAIGGSDPGVIIRP
jgi:hypothetical protein